MVHPYDAELDIGDAELRSLMKALVHDLRNPLAAIVTNLEFVRRVVTPSPDADLVESISDSAAACEVLRRIVTNLDLLVKGSRLNVTVHETDVAAICREVADRARTSAVQASVEVSFDDGGSRPRAMLDRSLLALALENVIGNALQHAPRGGVIAVRLGVADAEVRVEVTDDGKPIPREARELARSVEGNTADGRTPQSRYGRGASLLAARIAAAANGVAFEIDEVDGKNRFTLVVPRVG